MVRGEGSFSSISGLEEETGRDRLVAMVRERKDFQTCCGEGLQWLKGSRGCLERDKLVNQKLKPRRPES